MKRGNGACRSCSVGIARHASVIYCCVIESWCVNVLMIPLHYIQTIVLSALSRHPRSPFTLRSQVRVEQAIASQPSALVTFQLQNLLAFHTRTVGALLPPLPLSYASGAKSFATVAAALEESEEAAAGVGTGVGAAAGGGDGAGKQSQAGGGDGASAGSPLSASASASASASSGATDVESEALVSRFHEAIVAMRDEAKRVFFEIVAQQVRGAGCFGCQSCAV